MSGKCSFEIENVRLDSIESIKAALDEKPGAVFVTTLQVVRDLAQNPHEFLSISNRIVKISADLSVNEVMAQIVGVSDAFCRKRRWRARA